MELKAMKRQDLVAYLDELLDIRSIPDTSLNGLQVQGNHEVSTVGLAVDACEEIFRQAIEARVDFLIVHHGLFWGKAEPLVGGHLRRIKSLLENDMSLYAAHLPLDAHRELGNAAQLAQLLGLQVVCAFGDYQGVQVGVEAQPVGALSFQELANRVRERISPNARADAFGPESVRRVGIVTGSGASLLPEAVAHGLDTFITGEPRHSSFHYTREEHLNSIYAGHYCTETLGVKALGARLEQEFGLDTRFLDFPTGM
jgi:dinuclear metal center YbgI/SA1388 family protein